VVNMAGLTPSFNHFLLKCHLKKDQGRHPRRSSCCFATTLNSIDVRQTSSRRLPVGCPTNLRRLLVFYLFALRARVARKWAYAAPGNRLLKTARKRVANDQTRRDFSVLAMNFRGPQRVRIDQKPMPEILHPQDAIVRVTRSCICGSDLHLYNGSVPDTRVGMTFGHEFTGVVEQIGPEVQKLEVGDHVLVPFNIACGKCVFCQQGLFGNCHESNPQLERSRRQTH